MQREREKNKCRERNESTETKRPTLRLLPGLSSLKNTALSDPALSSWHDTEHPGGGMHVHSICKKPKASHGLAITQGVDYLDLPRARPSRTNGVLCIHGRPIRFKQNSQCLTQNTKLGRMSHFMSHKCVTFDGYTQFCPKIRKVTEKVSENNKTSTQRVRSADGNRRPRGGEIFLALSTDKLARLVYFYCTFCSPRQSPLTTWPLDEQRG